METHPILLDRAIARAAAALARGRRALGAHHPPTGKGQGSHLSARARARAASAAMENPLADHRGVSTRAVYQELEAPTGPSAPPESVRAAMRAWIAVLTLERVLWADAARIATAWRAETVELEKPEAMRTSPRALLRRILAEPSTERRRLLAAALADGAGGVADAVRIRAERRSEAMRRLDDLDPDALELPFRPAASLEAIASDLLDRTDPMASAAIVGSDAWSDAVPTWVGHRATSGWPAHLVPRWIEDLFRGTPLTEGLDLDLGPLPSALGASSFGRALAQFGAAYAEADVPRAAPFVLARPPFDLRRARRAALFGSLIADPLFGSRSLGLGRSAARDQAREIAAGFLLTLRVDAARVLLRRELLRSAADRGERLEELTARALGASLPGSLAGVLPSIEPGDAVRFAGALLAASDRASLIERFDEDWWKSPHACRALRDEQAVLESPVASEVELRAGLDALLRALAVVLG